MISRKLWDLNVPLIACQTIGFIAYMRVQVKEHTIVETHPDNELPDLRLDRPFECLKNHFDRIDLESMDLKDHSHTPYVTILYKYLEKFISEHGDIPKTYKEKLLLRDMIRTGMRKDEHGMPIGEENFEEAMKAVNATIGVTKVPKSVTDILNDERCVNLTAQVRTETSFFVIF